MHKLSIDTTWDFKQDNTKEFTHCFHPYPAMMIPQVARRILKEFGSEAKLLFIRIFHSIILHAIAIATCIFLIIHGSHVFAALAIIVRFGVLSFLEPHLFFYSLLSRKYNMHPKYVFFKRYYHYEFPFE
jgi:hypothetical protein